MSKSSEIAGTSREPLMGTSRKLLHRYVETSGNQYLLTYA